MILLDVLEDSKEWIWQYEFSSSKSIAETIPRLCGTVDPELVDACSRITLQEIKMSIFVDIVMYESSVHKNGFWMWGYWNIDFLL